MEDLAKCDSRWIISAKGDFVAHTLPILAGAVLAPLFWRYVPSDELPLWGYCIVVVFCDVGHVWTTIFRCYLDSIENRRRWVLYNLGPPLVFAATFVLHYFVSEAVCWTVIGYLAIFHFVRQQWGFLCLYRARAKDVEDARVDRVVHWAGVAGPVLLWHSDPSRGFDWFMREDSLPLRLPHSAQPFILAGWAAVLCGYCVRQLQLLRQGKCNAGKSLTMSYCWFTWAMGVLFPHKLIAVFFLNMFHAAPSYMITYYVCRNRWRDEKAPGLGERFIQWAVDPAPGRWVWYLMFFVVIASVEEVLWEALVWRDYFPEAFNFDLNPLGRSFCTALLVLPQTAHYFLDAFIWKLDSNPGLAYSYGLSVHRPRKQLQ
eukprot:TRINITY_DN25907_c0_g1_i1.p1 TRINITY_DN25907_c0_g1~~TRINITY_DN25907_c0_g1_i1.p1  ORF type:complete len:372 (+),score=119.57 TRINITY_DN25907_c0_g1_i1:78-1193(+)